jgi:uncharacterized protein
MILYLDTSAYVKLFIAETGSEQVAEAVARAAVVATHLIAYPEMRAAFAKARRMGRETDESLRLHTQELQRDWTRLTVIQPDEAMLFRAGDLAERYNLRGYDSVHLAAAESIGMRARNRAELRFAAFDERLVDAALGLGLDIL